MCNSRWRPARIRLKVAIFALRKYGLVLRRPNGNGHEWKKYMKDIWKPLVNNGLYIYISFLDIDLWSMLRFTLWYIWVISGFSTLGDGIFSDIQVIGIQQDILSQTMDESSKHNIRICMLFHLKKVRSSASHAVVKTWKLITLKMVVKIEGTSNVLFTNRDPFHYWFTHSKSILVPHVLNAIQKHRK